MHSILIVDADSSSTTMLRFLLEADGYTVTTIKSAERALEAIGQNEYDLILLDVVLPNMDGLELCPRSRATSHVPIIFLSVRGDVADKVLGLRAGADDYLSKPFDTDEVLARIWALLRRTVQPAPSKLQLRHADLTLDLAAHTVTLPRTGKVVRLTPIETRLLHALLRNAGHSMTRDALVLTVWGYEYDPRGNELDVQIRRLRRKIEEAPSDPKLIQTVPGVGYRLMPPRYPPPAEPGQGRGVTRSS
ncbi:MAG TPA: response regulator transcription factor [Herpetosiphonaceae bacterium]|nr:response regulator transcription factor [Herpetosiphonaceae bacterium]